MGRGARRISRCHGAAKVAFHNRAMLAKLMGLAEDAITMVESDVGGGFGVRGEFYPEDFLIPFAARRLGRPVKWIEDRREHLLATNHARDAECELEIACDRDGTIRGLRGRGAVDLGAYIRTNGVTAARNIAQVLSGPYRIPHVHFDVDLLLTNKTPSGTYRGPGRFEADFFRERLFDIAARELGIDRVEFRRRNLMSRGRDAVAARHGDAARHRHRDRQRRLPGDARPLPRRVRLGGEVQAAGPAASTAAITASRSAATSKAAASGPRENARLVVEADGAVSVYVGSSAHRPGHRDDLRADRRRRARPSDEPHPRRDARLDHACERAATAPTARARP